MGVAACMLMDNTLHKSDAIHEEAEVSYDVLVHH